MTFSLVTTNNFRYAVEVRHTSWFSDLAYNYFSNSNISMVWNQLDKINAPPIVTSDFVYLRLIDDRAWSLLEPLLEKEKIRLFVERTLLLAFIPNPVRFFA